MPPKECIKIAFTFSQNGVLLQLFCKDENSSQTGDVNERTHLLIDPVSNNSNVQRVNSEDILSRNPNILPKKTDEQSALTRILQETAANVIDVAALGTHNLQQHDYLERMKLYNVRVQQILNNSRHKFNKKGNCILQDIPNPEKVLNCDPIAAEDLNLIISAVAGASAAISDIKVDHKEDLVVPFGLLNS